MVEIYGIMVLVYVNKKNKFKFLKGTDLINGDQDVFVVL